MHCVGLSLFQMHRLGDAKDGRIQLTGHQAIDNDTRSIQNAEGSCRCRHIAGIAASHRINGLHHIVHPCSIRHRQDIFQAIVRGNPSSILAVRQYLDPPVCIHLDLQEFRILCPRAHLLLGIGPLHQIYTDILPLKSRSRIAYDTRTAGVVLISSKGVHMAVLRIHGHCCTIDLN